MTYLREVTTEASIKNSDQNGRLRTNVSNLAYDARFNYSAQPSMFGNVLANGATAVHNPFMCGVTVSVGTASTSSAMRTSYKYHPPSNGRMSTMNIIHRLGPQKANVVSRMGMYDDGDGVFLERTATGLTLVLRSYASGSIVETRVPQAQWNQDRLDGTGRSKVIYLADNIQTMILRFSNTGVGTVSIGFLVNGGLVTAHIFTLSNASPLPALRPVGLPIRCEIFNTGSTPSASTLFLGNCAFFIDGPYPPKGQDVLTFTTNTGNSAINIAQSSVYTHIASFRLAELKGGIKYRGSFYLQNTDIQLVGDGSIMWIGVINATLSGTQSWAVPDIAPGSVLERNMSASGFSGGFPILSGYGSSSGSGKNRMGDATIEGTGKPVLYGKSLGPNDTLTFGIRAMNSGLSAFVIMNHNETEE